MRKLQFFVLAVLVAAIGASSSLGAQPSVSGSWVGTYTLGGPGHVAFTVQGSRAAVVLGVGHADLQTVPLSRRGPSIRFLVPGRPQPVVFAGRLRGGVVRGTVSQGAAHGKFGVRRGTAPSLVARGSYAVGSRTLAVVDDPFGFERLVDLDSGEVHAIFPARKGFEIGSGFATRNPIAGSATFSATGAIVSGSPGSRIATRQLEVRFRSGDATLSGTLTLPPGPGPHPGVAFVAGSGATMRAYLPDLQMMLVRNGVALLAYDKRGIGQSGGQYPGESATATTIDTLARDAEAAARFLATQPEIDPKRVGLAGHSQAGWIMPLAASREPAIRFLVVFSGPTVTVDESDLYQDLTGQGERPQTLTNEQIDAEVLRQGPGGVDPMPWIASLHIPVIWLYGGLDMHIPTRLSIRRLEPLLHDPNRDFTVAVFPNANHALVETKTGLTSEMLKSDHFAPGLFPRVAEWLRAHGLSSG